MAVSTCAKCGGHIFELAPFTPVGERHKFTLVQCAGCGTPVGALESAAAPLIADLKTQIASIDERLARIAKALTA